MNLSLSSLFLVSLCAALIPLLITSLTSYVKISVVLSVLRGAFGGTQIPSNAVIGILSLLLSMMIMTPVLRKMQERLTPERIRLIVSQNLGNSYSEILEVAAPWFDFLKAHQSEHERNVFIKVFQRAEDSLLSPYEEGLVTVTSFLVAELKRGFVSAIVLLLPFVIIDIVCAQILTAVGLTLLTPTIVSLPLKLFLFVQVDGWLLLARGFVRSY